MSQISRLDVVIFGATGYTGQYVVEEMARKGKQFGLKWGVAGRTVDKLKQILQQASSITGDEYRLRHNKKKRLKRISNFNLI